MPTSAQQQYFGHRAKVALAASCSGANVLDVSMAEAFKLLMNDAAKTRV